MTEENRKIFAVTEQGLMVVLRFMTVLMLPMVTTAVLSMLGLLTYGRNSAFLDVCCLLVNFLVWAGAVVCTKTRFMGNYMPKTGLVLSAMLTGSVLFYALSYAMEQEALSFRAEFWALGRLLGAPVAVSSGGIRVLFGGITEGAAILLTCALYLAVSLAAALPWKGGRIRT
ncbi:MAG: hypothetical protein IKY52_13365 [Clostridia bacterium]|nr:hypothetical protein [Clostridia bacterium]